MKHLLLCLLLSLSGTALAAAPETDTSINSPALMIKMALKIDGKIVSRPTITTVSGKTASITSATTDGNGTSIEVIPTLRDNNVYMKFVVAKLEKGKKTILGKPRMVTLMGEPAEITQDNMSLTATVVFP